MWGCEHCSMSCASCIMSARAVAERSNSLTAQSSPVPVHFPSRTWTTVMVGKTWRIWALACTLPRLAKGTGAQDASKLKASGLRSWLSSHRLDSHGWRAGASLVRSGALWPRRHRSARAGHERISQRKTLQVLQFRFISGAGKLGHRRALPRRCVRPGTVAEWSWKGLRLYF